MKLCEIAPALNATQILSIRFRIAAKYPTVLRRTDIVLAFDKIGGTKNRSIDRNGNLHVTLSNISKANVCPYRGDEIPNYKELGLDPSRIYQLFRSPEELAKGAATFNNLPLLKRHVPISADDTQPSDVVGSTGSHAEFVAPYLRNSLSVWDAAARDGILDDTVKQLSCAYMYRADMTPGSYKGIVYDGVMREIHGNHVALVEAGRAGSDVVVGDEMPKPMFARKKPMAARRTPAAKKPAGPQVAQDAALKLFRMMANDAFPPQSDKPKNDKGDPDENEEAAAESGLVGGGDVAATPEEHTAASAYHKQTSALHTDISRTTGDKAHKAAANAHREAGTAHSVAAGDLTMSDIAREKSEEARDKSQKALKGALASDAKLATKKLSRPKVAADSLTRSTRDHSMPRPTQMQSIVEGALRAALASKLKPNANLAFDSVLEEVDPHLWNTSKKRVYEALKVAVKGKLAQDADIGDIVDMLDALKEKAEEIDEEGDTDSTNDDNPLEDDISNNEDDTAEDEEDDDEEDTKPLKLPVKAGAKTTNDKKARDSMKAKDAPAPVRAKDRKGASDGAISRVAMDAAIAKAKREAETSTIARLREVADAEKFVRPWVGELAMAHDSAIDVYRTALDAMEVDTKGINDPKALKLVLGAQPKPGEVHRARSGTQMAADSARASGGSADTEKLWPGFGRLK